MSTDPPSGGLQADIGEDNRGNVVHVAAGGSTGDIINLTLYLADGSNGGALLSQAPTVSPPATTAAGFAAPSVDIARYAPIIEQALAGVRAAEQAGQAVEAVQTGEVRVSKVELLLKRAVIVKTEASQMMAENAAAKQQELQALLVRFQQAGAPGPGAMEQFQAEGEALIWRGFDREAYTSKLIEAKELFEEALTIDEANGQALLQLADLLMALTPDDTSDEERILARAHALLSHPSGDDDRFMQAQALMLSAMSLQLKYRRTLPGPELLGAAQTYQAALTEARDQFQKLGRTIWATAADNMLQASRAAVANWAGVPQPNAGASTGYGGGYAAWPPTPTPPPFAQSGPGAFQPVGQWAVTATAGGIVVANAYLTFGADQRVEGVVSWVNGEFRGTWDYAPMSGVLSVQGISNGVITSAWYIQIVAALGNEASGVDSAGNMYSFLRAA